MNERGQVSSSFRLFVYAIVVLAIILLVYNLFIIQPSDPLQEMKKSIAYSQANPGKSYTKEIFFPEGFSVSATGSLDDTQTNVSFRCDDTRICGKGIDATPKRDSSLGAATMDVTTRCVYEYGIFECKAYFGLPPAQAMVSETEVPGFVDLEHGKPTVNIEVTNSGMQTAAHAFLSVELYKKELVQNQETEILYSSVPATEFIETLGPGETKSFAIPLDITHNGDFVARYKFEGIDSGYDEGMKRFSVVGAEKLQFCFATTVGNSFLNVNENICETQFFCNGCPSASECAFAWQKTEPEGGFVPVTTDYSILAYEPYDNGKCSPDPAPENNGGSGSATGSGDVGTDGGAGSGVSGSGSNDGSGTDTGSGTGTDAGSGTGTGSGNGDGSAVTFEQLLIDSKPISQLVAAELQRIKENGENIAATEKAKQFETDIQQRSNGMDVALIKGIIATESFFNPKAVSSTGCCYGLMQVSEENLRGTGYPSLNQNDVFLQWQDPATNIDRGTDLFQRRVLPEISKYNCGNAVMQGSGVSRTVALAIGAYNSGDGKVEYKSCEAPNLSETKNYIPRVLAFYQVFKDAEQATVQAPPETSTPQEPAAQPVENPDVPETQNPESGQEQGVGDAVQQPPVSNAWAWPVGVKEVNSCFGYRPYLGRGNLHGGIDMAVPKNTQVKAVAKGVVVRVAEEGTNSGFGRFVVIKHAPNLFSSYNHLEKTLVKEGQGIEQGTIVGLSGNSGGNYGYHLHLAVFISENDLQIGARGRNPVCYFPQSLVSSLTFTGRNCVQPEYPDPRTNGC